uniref:(northern house mosquito) hypothetical protein n=1 Tax=Culex pipiens TaxID=7175 RepID=A0A8D8JBB7_CULPI
MLLELGRPVNASLLVLPSCQSLTRALSRRVLSRPFCVLPHDVTSRGPFCGTSLQSTYTSSLATSQAKRATYTPHRFILSVFHLLRKFLRSGFFTSFFFLLCFVTAYYTSHERLMILNLACFKAFCSSSSSGFLLLP